MLCQLNIDVTRDVICVTIVDQVVIDVAISQWRARLGACVEAEGGHFEHTL